MTIPMLEKCARAMVEEGDRWFIRVNKTVRPVRDEICRHVDDEREVEVIEEVPWGDGDLYVWDMRHKAQARAVLTALLEPDEGMVEAMKATAYDSRGTIFNLQAAFIAAVSHILKGEGNV